MHNEVRGIGRETLLHNIYETAVTKSTGSGIVFTLASCQTLFNLLMANESLPPLPWCVLLLLLCGATPSQSATLHPLICSTLHLIFIFIWINCSGAMAAIWVLLLCIYPTNSSSRSVYGEGASVHQTKCISISDRVFSSILEYRVAIVHVQAIAFSYPHTHWHWVWWEREWVTEGGMGIGVILLFKTNSDIAPVKECAKWTTNRTWIIATNLMWQNWITFTIHQNHHYSESWHWHVTNRL